MLALPVLLLLALFAALAISSAAGNSVTGDEVAHLPAGYTYVRTGDFRLNPQHPPLAKALAGLPLLALDLDPVAATPGWEEADEWTFGREFLIGNRQPLRRILLLGRLPMVAVGLLLGALLFAWARELWGYGPALFVLLLYALSPNFLGHAALVTTDVAVVCFTVLALYALWRMVRGGGRRYAVGCGLGLGLALLAKYTGVVTAGLVAVLAAGAWFLDRSFTPRRAAAGLGVIFALALLVVALGFGAPAGLLHYRDGFARIYADANPRWEGFLWGEYSPTGFRHYYLLAMLWKTPLPTLVAFAVALVSVSAATPRRRVDWLFVLLPFAAFHAAGAFNPANIGIRHVLPAYPFLFLACGAAAARLGRARWPGRAGLAALCVWLAAGTLRAHPHYISYFNGIAGGAEGGIHHLDDSNVEWGQDYWRLARWVERRRPSELAVSAFEPLAPSAYGLDYRSIGLADVTRPTPGVTYVAGAHHLQRNSLFDDWPGVRFEWLRRYRPVERIGGSLLVYRFSIDPADEGSPNVVYLPPERWFEDSIDQLEAILGRSPRFPLARALLAADFLDRARWREREGDPEAAFLDYVRSAEVAGGPTSTGGGPPWAGDPAAELRAAVDRLRPALEAAALAAPGAYCLDGTFERAAGELGPAAVALLRCLATRPDDLAARANLARTFRELGLSTP
ncbi:MAG TPA: glycosyltransferase family 39 protein [Thermoanaerobaculia bacterium]|nr:glycosyltransferase family 39 protein [Thermoanaerobaculia bacterium]